MNSSDIYQQAVKKWGIKDEFVVAIEEMAELTKVLTKHLRGKLRWQDRALNASLIEETADVEIMLEQIKEAFGIHTQVEEVKQVKLRRLEDRLALQGEKG